MILKSRLTYSVCKTLYKRMTQYQSFSNQRNISKYKILGIETTCDDTGAAVVDENAHILGNALHSQTSISVSLGGVLPPYAKALHEKHIHNIVQDALTQAGVEIQDLDAVAVAVEPGLPLSLDVGLKHAQKLVMENRVPLIPVHHMEAHALTARMIDSVEFPFLVLLVSGGHCLLAVARDIDDFLLLGSSIDNAPGEIFDKVARRMKLKNLPQCYGKSGGASIELMAQQGDPDMFEAPHVYTKSRSCNFSFAGMKAHYCTYIEQEEKKQGIVASGVISNAADVCASFQFAVLRHMCRPIERAFRFCDYNNLLPETKTLVVSGGVACNQYLRAGLQRVCDKYGARLVVPPPHLCTDNGIMIAWNGMEKLLAGRGIADDPIAVKFKPKSPLGQDISEEVTRENIKVIPMKL
ncbi:tRNA N6-adenosine threonylcarbamoyltransferase, mitochondrial-like [Mya arenaria]|uniref:tRNA N6-adenosine threonylcarbamoyltransferase, mitochondrial-like n=1 Tax=Mya arenaria TaxID=6604 RepID=UPI0022E117ED|nr:tRNA N6-adenosine threonylcarbamoyltransferase, mitochondrial-like [Mya arenaria]